MAASPADLKLKLQRETTCLFCQGELNDPKLLECLHFYCKNCIYHMRIANTQTRYKCPQCSDTLNIEDIDKLHSFTLAKIQTRNLHILRKVTQQEDPPCDLCIANNGGHNRRRSRIGSNSGNIETALYVCTDCRDGQQFLCHACSMSHYHKLEYSDHVLELVTNFHSSIVSASPKPHNRRRSTMAASICHNHGLQFRFFCQSCSVGLCNDCLINHKDHNIIETGDAVEDAQRFVTQELLDIIQVREVLALSIKPIEEIKIAVVHQTEFVMSEIETRFVRINKEIGFSQKKLINQLQSVSQSKQSMLQQQIQQIQVLIEKANRLTNLMSQAAGMSDETALMSLVNLFIEKARSLKSEYTAVLAQPTGESAAKIATIKRQISLVPCEKANMALLLHPEDIKKSLRDSGIYIQTAYPPNCIAYGPGISKCPLALNLTYFNIQLFNINSTPCSQYHDVQIKINILTMQGSTLTEKPKIVHKRQGKYLVTYCPRSSGEATINVTVDDTDIQGSPFIVIIQPPSPLSPDDCKFSTIKELHSPVCLTILHDNGGHLLVYDESENGTLLLIDETSGRVKLIFKSEFKSINGIDVMKDDFLSFFSPSSSFSVSSTSSPSSSFNSSVSHFYSNNIYVSSSTNHCIAKLSLKDDGTCQISEQIGSRGNKESQFDTPAGILAVKGEVFVCDSLNHRIQVFDGFDLKYKRKIEMNCLSSLLTFPCEPIDITMNENNNLLISDAKNNCVLFFTSQEKYRSCFWQVIGVINGGQQDKLCVPYGLSCDRDGYLYVSDTGNNRIVVYNSQSGECINTLGGIQEETGDDLLDVPKGIAVDREGRIFICDTLHKKLRVFSDTLVKTISY